MQLDGTAVAVAAITALPAMLAWYESRKAKRVGRDNAERLDVLDTKATRIDKQTNGEMDHKIQTAVMQVFKEHKQEVTEAVMAESMRHLLDMMINGESRELS